ncbi:MAG: rhodanese-like domain-containing protein [Marivibrio sp.]|uniref:rhodanese-like domain-containing protein n=1 Tax=Marivibrio sp. TaxID=2039719 RepID=UPI0032EC43C2
MPDARPVPARPVPTRPVPTRPVPNRAVPDRPVCANPSRRAAIACAAAAALTLSLGAAAPATAESVMTPEETLARVEGGEMLLLDIRRPSEWAATGVPTPAREVTMHLEGGPRAFLRAVDAAVAGDRDRPVALICASGVRTTWASRFLTANGYSAVYNVKEGVLGRGPDSGWISRGLPMRDCETCGSDG